MERKLSCLHILSLILFAFILAACRPAPEGVPTRPVALETATAISTPLPLPTRTSSPLPLEAWMDETVDLEHFTPGATLIIHFNQPMAHFNPAEALILSPHVTGRMWWDENYTQLSFTSFSGLTAGQAYVLTLSDQLASASGARLSSPPQWRLQVTAAPQVTKRQPSGTSLAKRRPVIRLDFSQAMDHASVEAALKVDPSVPLSLSWQDQALTIEPGEPLMPGAWYKFELTPTAKDVYGLPLAEPYRWSYQLDKLVNVSNLPSPKSVKAASTSGGQLSPIVLRFNYPMDGASVQAAFTTQPGIEGETHWDEAGSRLIFTPTARLKGYTHYQLGFEGRLLDAEGDECPLPELFEFTGPAPVLAVKPPAGDVVHPAANIEITFDRLMDQAATQAAFHITPMQAGRFEWRETTLIFQPEGDYLTAYTNYQVGLDASARDQQGQPILDKTYTWSFQTGQLRDIASFGYGPNAQVLDADGRRAIQFELIQGSPGAITFDLYQLNLGQFLDRYSSGFRGVAGYENRLISTQDAPLVKHWPYEASVASGEHYVKETLIPADVAPGLYILNVSAGHLNDQLIVILTRQTLMLKQAEGQIVAWVTDINGGSIADMDVHVFARDGQLISQGRSDENGVYRTQVSRDPQPLIVIASRGDEITASGLSNEWRSSGRQWWGWWQPAPVAVNYALHIYTDRPIYRPGHTVFFKGIVRADDDALLSTPPEGTLVKAYIRDARNNVVKTLELKTNAFGSVNADFQLAEGAMLGQYAVEMTIEGETHRQIFKVQDYRKPDYQVSLTPSAGRVVAGDTVTVVVEGRYFFDQPVSNADLTVQFYELGTPYYYDSGGAGDEEEVNADDYTWFSAKQATIKAKTDANGVYTFTFPATLGQYAFGSSWRSSARQGTWGIEASLDDGSHQTVSNFTAVRVFNSATQISLDSNGFFHTPGQPFSLRAKATDINGQPVGGLAMQLYLRRYDHSKNDYSQVAQSADLTSAPDGWAAASFTIAEAGFYQLHLTHRDERGNVSDYNSYVYAFSDASQWVSNSGEMRITADQASYASGQTARLAIESVFSGPALLTFERATTRRERLIELTAPLTLIDVPIQPDDAPNIYVTVNAWQPQDTTLSEHTYSSLPDSRLWTASVKLSVPVTDKSLTVSITPDCQGRSPCYFAPRETADVTLRVSDEHGQPVQAEVSLAMVDEAIFSLSKELSGPIFEAFYRQRPNIVRTYDAMALDRYLGGGMGGGGGGDGVSGANPRTEFPDTAAWLPTLQTDANGQIVLHLKLPDSLTSWRLTAKAVSNDHQVGETFVNLVTRQNVIVQPILPRSLTVGDQAALSAMVHNTDQRERTVSVSMQADPRRLKVAGVITQTISLAAGERRVIGWSGLAVSPGVVSVTILADPWGQSADRPADEKGGGDAIQVTLPIRPLATRDVASLVGALEDEWQTTLDWPETAMDISNVEIEVSRSIAGTLLTGLDYLTGFPYGCVEQTMSRALPNAVVGRAFYQLGVEDPTIQAELPAKINASVQRLYGYQHNDGGWGWWYDDSTHDYQTAWVVFGLAVTQQAGYEIDSAVIERGAKWLKDNLASMDIRTRAYALYSLAIAGSGDLPATQEMAIQLEELDAFSQAAVALALHQLGADQEAQAALEVLATSAIVQEGKAHWSSASEDGHYYNKTMSSDTRSTALALSAFANIQPGHELEAGIVNWLMSQRRREGWGSTNETSFAILGLTDHLLTIEAASQATGYSIELNGQVVASGELKRGQATARLTLPASQMLAGKNDLRISSQGGRLFYRVNTQLYQAQSSIEAAGAVKVSREYLDAKTNRPIEQVHVGQLIKVRLSVDLPNDGAYIIVEDPLPGGLEALNENLNTSSHEEIAYTEPRYYWQDYGYNQKEVHAERVTFFVTEMDKAERTFTYLARAMRAGEFTALPTEAYAMYDLTVWGRSTSQKLSVAEQEEVK